LGVYWREKNTRFPIFGNVLPILEMTFWKFFGNKLPEFLEIFLEINFGNAADARKARLHMV